MNNEVKITIYEGTSKAGKAYSALRVKVGKLEKLIFDLDEVQLDYAKQVLGHIPKPADVTDSSNSFLEEN